MEQIIFGNVRVQLLTPEIVRLEYAKKGAFCDDDTFFVPNRKAFNGKVEYRRYGNYINFGDYSLTIPVDGRSLSGITLTKKGLSVYRYKKVVNSGELPALNKTPEVFVVSDTPRIIVPEGGYSKNRKGRYKVTEDVQDIYLLLCGKDAKKLRKLYVELTGGPELVRLSTLGSWNSKYYAYTEKEAKQVILDYESHGVPLDVIVIDTDWRSCENGWGYEVNKNLFPNMKRFFEFAHSHGVDVAFNDHPEPKDGLNVFHSKEIAYRERNLQTLMKMGLDIWWYDRNWSTRLISPSENLRCETLGLYLFSDITKNFYQKKAGDDKVYRRPDVMGNVVDVANGNYLGIQDTASHRYSVQWTGDVGSSSEIIAQEVENLILAGNNCVSYVNSDCGGHTGNPDKETFIRWMQFGTTSPVFRPHCTNSVIRTREPWVYDDETLKIVKEYNALRYRLMPVIYKNAYNAYLTGEPIFKSTGYEYPDDRHAMTLVDQYMLGNDLIFKPVSRKKAKRLQKENFLKPVKATYYDGIDLKGKPIAKAQYDVLDMELHHTSPEAGVPVYNFSARFQTEIQFEKDVELFVRSDDGVTVYIDGEKIFEDKTCHAATDANLGLFKAGKPYKVEIEYFQAGGDAAISLGSVEFDEDKTTKVYLPNGKWLDAFSGKIYSGKKTVQREYALAEHPTFIRLGAIIPLAKVAQNTKLQKWNDLTFDFYPCFDSADEGYLYEDDTETTAYQLGKLRKTAYSATFDKKINAFVVKINASNGSFDGEKCFDNRNITIKAHLLGDVKDIKKVTVNGKEVAFTKSKKDLGAFPLNGGETSLDGAVIVTEFNEDVTKDYEIKFYL